MFLIALGAGGIKPCVSAHGGDQYLPNQRKGLDLFFSVFYLAINIGSLMSGSTTPFMREKIMCFGAPCYFSAYTLCAAVFVLSTLVFICGERFYRIVPPRGEFLPAKCVMITVKALGKWLKIKWVSLRNDEWFRDGHPERRSQSFLEWIKLKWAFIWTPNNKRRSKSSFLDCTIDEYGEEIVTETKLLWSIIALLLPVCFFFSVYDQGQNEWQFQYNMMRPSGIPVEGNILSEI